MVAKCENSVPCTCAICIENSEIWYLPIGCSVIRALVAAGADEINLISSDCWVRTADPRPIKVPSFPGPTQLSITCTQTPPSFPSLAPRPHPAFHHLHPGPTQLSITCTASKAIDKWVLEGAEALPNFWHSIIMKDIAHSAQHTTAYDV